MDRRSQNQEAHQEVIKALTLIQKYFKGISLIVVTIGLTSCITYYQRNEKFNSAFQDGDIKHANQLLDHDRKAEKRKTKFLYFLNKGVTEQLLGNYDTSNYFFEKAYLFGEDYQMNIGNEVLSFLTNPNMKEYKGESFEHLMVNYYKALNYMFMKDYEAALVEVKRMQIRLDFYNDQFIGKQDDKKYNKDAFINTLMGLVYQANKDYNNAFIAYRNAHNIYQEFYQKHFYISAPKQLEKDLLYCAYKSGLNIELKDYENELGIKYTHQERGEETVFIWHNGLVPVKDEWTITFWAVGGTGGYIYFKNEELGIDFPFYVGKDEEKNILEDITTLKVAFPKYVSRDPIYQSAQLKIGNEYYKLDRAQDLDGIAKKSLKDRMMKELGTSLLRLASKKASEIRARREHEALGSILGIFHAVTEKADTRHWQSLPNQIAYTRIPKGQDQVSLALKENAYSSRTILLDIPDGSEFYMYHTVATRY